MDDSFVDINHMRMKKNLLLFVCLVLAGNLYAQKNSFSEGDKLLNLGIGLNSYYSGGIPFGASFEYGVTDVISAGANIDYLSYTYDYAGFGSYKFTALYIGARGSYHFNELLNLNNDKIDLYAGVTLGYRSFSWSDDFNGSIGDSYGSGVFFGIYAGGKYYFTEKIAAFTELGAVGSTNVRLGVAFRF